MADEILTIGTLYISHEVRQLDKWLQDQAISAAMIQMRKYLGLDGLLKSSKTRLGDFSLIIADLKVSPIIVSFIGVPGRNRAAIVQELFVKS